MNRTTRIKTAQAPRMYNLDLTNQLDGVRQTFNVPGVVNEQSTHYLLWNGTVYRNDPQHTYYTFSSDWHMITTYFDHAPSAGAHRSLILVVSDNADGSDEGSEVYLDNQHLQYVNITSNDGYATSIAGKTIRSFTEEEEQAIDDAIQAESEARSDADDGLQEQIDTLVAASDVKDVVGTHAALDNYDTSSLGDNDIIKVLQDEDENNETTYYRWSVDNSEFTLIGAEGPYYTKSAADEKFATIDYVNSLMGATEEELEEI